MPSPSLTSSGLLQVKLYFPGTVGADPTDPYSGIVRAVVKDSSDIYIGEDTVTFLDSNGDVSRLFVSVMEAVEDLRPGQSSRKRPLCKATTKSGA